MKQKTNRQPDFTTTRNCDIEECNGADKMEHPEAVAVDPTTGKVFVADSSNSRVLRFASGAAGGISRPLFPEAGKILPNRLRSASRNPSDPPAVTKPLAIEKSSASFI